MKKIIILFLLIISDTVYSSNFLIDQIFFKGLYRFAEDAMLCKLPFKIGDTIKQNDITDGIKILFSTGYFEEISIFQDNDGIVLVVVKEYPVISSISLHGNKIIKKEAIQRILNTKKITIGEPLNDCSVFEIRRELQDLFYDFGKFDATVKIITDILPQNRVNIKLIFSERETAKIIGIKIFGNKNFSQKQLLNQLKLYKYIRYKNIFFNSLYQKQKLFSDLEKLRYFYLNRGYAKFYINETRIELTPDKKNIYLFLYIDEGSKYVLESIKISGNISSYIKNIDKYLQFLPRELYNESKIQTIEYDIRCILKNNGYIQPVVSMKRDFNDQNKTIKLHIYVDVGERFYAREIRIEGNNFTQDSVIRREIKQMEGSPLNYVNLMHDRERLNRFTYFKEVDVQVEHNVSDISNQVDVVYRITERNTGNVNVSMGMGTESGVNMQVGINQENILGTGNLISVTAIKNHYQTYVDILLLKHYWGINKDRVSGQIFYNKLITDKLNVSHYHMESYGVNMNYTYPSIYNSFYNIGLEFVSNYLSGIQPQVSAWRYLYSVGINPDFIINQNYTSNTVNFRANDLILVSGWSLDNLNSVYFPKSGSCASIINKMTLPGSNNKYYKIIINNNHYLPLDKDLNWVFMHSIYVGYAGSLYSKKESPFYDNFYLGGIESVRGFRLNSIGPKAAYYNCHVSNTNYFECSVENSHDSVGGNAIVFVKNELIVPMKFFKNQEYANTIRVAFFLDAGTTWDTYWKNTTETQIANILDYSVFKYIRLSSGIAVKWVSPIGPVMFSYSKLLKKYPGDIEEPFQFTIGKNW